MRLLAGCGGMSVTPADEGRPPDGNMRAPGFPSRHSLIKLVVLVTSMVSTTHARKDQQLFDVDAAKQWHDEGYLPQGKVTLNGPGPLNLMQRPDDPVRHFSSVAGILV